MVLNEWTLEVKVALLNFPPVISTIPAPVEIEVMEVPFLEDKYGLLNSRTFRRIFMRVSSYPEDSNLVSVLKKLEQGGLLVPTEKLFDLREGEMAIWNAACGDWKLKICVMPAQRELSQLAQKVMLNRPFEEAFQLFLINEQ